MLTIRNVAKRFGADIHALRGVSLEIMPGEVLALLGPSGCGKTTLLRIIAGLESMDTGSILLDGHDLTRIPIHRRNFGFMFQDFALFPHQTVAENIAFGLRMRNDKPAAIQARVDEMLELVNLPGYGARTIFELSGGERQRVALARSLAPNPRLLMLDEPLGSLDRNLRESLAQELRAILRDIGLTAIYVTHDQQEALVMSDRLAIMRQGNIEQLAAPETVYRTPASEFVARFLGFRNLIPITGQTATGALQTALGVFPLPPNVTDASADRWEPTHHALLIRPESARLASTMPQPEPGPAAFSHATSNRRIILRGILESAVFFGVDYRITVCVENAVPRAEGSSLATPTRLYFDLPSHQMDLEHGILSPTRLPVIGEPIALSLFPDILSLIPLDSVDDA
ncbi:MAG: ABC transporter ATP-binding protein [Litorilinea sp.]